jgi:GWxTD domain-containing protein
MGPRRAGRMYLSLRAGPMYFYGDTQEYPTMIRYTIPTSPRTRARPSALALVAPLLLLAVTALHAQEPGPLNFAYAYSVFELDDTSSLVELNYQYSERGLTYERVDGRHIGSLMIGFRVWDSTGRIVADHNWITTSPRPEEGDEDHALLGVKVFGFRPGTYKARIAFADENNPGRRDSADFTLGVRKFPKNRIALSDVQIISEITPSTDETNRFYKNGYIIYPNVLSAIEPPFLLLNSYLEIYNANTAPTSQFEIVYSLADTNRTIFYQKEEKRDRPASQAIVDVHSLILDELPSGTYLLLVKAFAGLRGTATDSALIWRSLTIYNPDKDSMLANGRATAIGTTSAVDPLYAGMNEKELDREFNMNRHIALDRERQMYTELAGAEAKARFLSEFWQRRDPDLATPQNELREEYQKRIDAANALYREPLVDAGYQTDRGRVLLKYGKPDQVDRHYYDRNRKPYEIWYFSKDNLRFVFVDRSSTGKFVLVHSENAPGEVRQDNWEKLFATVHEYLDN